MAVRANTGQSPNFVSMLGQRQLRLTGIESAMGCDAGLGRPTLCCMDVGQTKQTKADRSSGTPFLVLLKIIIVIFRDLFSSFRFYFPYMIFNMGHLCCHG